MKNLKITILGLTALFLLLTVSVVKTEAVEKSLSSSTFVVWDQGGVIGYVAGFDVSGAIFNDANSIVVKLYRDNTLLQTNTANPNTITGTSFLTPFDVFGNFDYTKDGYFVNKRESEYGKNMVPNKVTATISFNDGSNLSFTNSNLVGDTLTIFSRGEVLGQNKFNFSQKMMLGVKNNEVLELQKLLNSQGYGCGPNDGSFGPKTKACTIKYQLVNGLQGDGIIGPLTRAILNK